MELQGEDQGGRCRQFQPAGPAPLAGSIFRSVSSTDPFMFLFFLVASLSSLCHPPTPIYPTDRVVAPRSCGAKPCHPAVLCSPIHSFTPTQRQAEMDGRAHHRPGWPDIGDPRWQTTTTTAVMLWGKVDRRKERKEKNGNGVKRKERKRTKTKRKEKKEKKRLWRMCRQTSMRRIHISPAVAPSSQCPSHLVSSRPNIFPFSTSSQLFSERARLSHVAFCILSFSLFLFSSMFSPNKTIAPRPICRGDDRACGGRAGYVGSICTMCSAVSQYSRHLTTPSRACRRGDAGVDLGYAAAVDIRVNTSCFVHVNARSLASGLSARSL